MLRFLQFDHFIAVLPSSTLHCYVSHNNLCASETSANNDSHIVEKFEKQNTLLFMKHIFFDDVVVLHGLVSLVTVEQGPKKSCKRFLERTAAIISNEQKMKIKKQKRKLQL